MQRHHSSSNTYCGEGVERGAPPAQDTSSSSPSSASPSSSQTSPPPPATRSGLGSGEGERDGGAERDRKEGDGCCRDGGWWEGGRGFWHRSPSAVQPGAPAQPRPSLCPLLLPGGRRGWKPGISAPPHLPLLATPGAEQWGGAEESAGGRTCRSRVGEAGQPNFSRRGPQDCPGRGMEGESVSERLSVSSAHVRWGSAGVRGCSRRMGERPLLHQRRLQFRAQPPRCSSVKSFWN